MTNAEYLETQAQITFLGSLVIDMDLVLPNGQTVGQKALPPMREAQAAGKSLPMLTAGSGA